MCAEFKLELAKLKLWLTLSFGSCFWRTNLQASKPADSGLVQLDYSMFDSSSVELGVTNECYFPYFYIN